MKDSGSPPPAPDYTSAAQATASGNLALAQQQTDANRINQYTPFGSLTYTSTPGVSTPDTAAYNNAMGVYNTQLANYNAQKAAYDANNSSSYMGGGGDSGYSGGGLSLTAPPTAPVAPNQADYMTGGNPTWTQTTTLNPQLQSALDSQLAITQGRSDTAQGLLGQVNQNYSQPFQAPQLGTYLNGVDGVNQNYGSFSSSAPRQITGLQTLNTSNVQGQNQNGPMASQYLGGLEGVNQNAPQYNPNNQTAYAQNAYNAQMALLQPGIDRQTTSLNNSLALQGLTPGTQASNNALGSYYDSLAAQKNSLASSAYLTGNQAANQDYASQLSGYNAQNNARTQALNNNMTVYQGNLAGTAANNAASNTQFNQQLQGFNAGLQGTAAANNAAATQFGLDAQGFNTNLNSQNMSNAAQQQAYAQALQTYGTQYGAAQNAYNQPLNTMNALLSGQQVQNPQFTGFATQGQTQGADLLGAAQQQAAYNQNAWNAQAAQAAQSNAALGSLAGSGLMAYAAFAASDVRLKENIQKVGETPGGSNVYTWDWKGGRDYLGPKVGVIAQENPSIAVKTPSGYLAVDYSKLK